MRDPEQSCPHIDTIIRILDEASIVPKDKEEIIMLLERIRSINFELRIRQ